MTDFKSNPDGSVEDTRSKISDEEAIKLLEIIDAILIIAIISDISKMISPVPQNPNKERMN